MSSPVETVRAAYAAFAKNDPSVLFGALHPEVDWREAEGSPFADGNPYVGPQAVGALFGRLLSTVDNLTVVPGTFIDGGSHVVVTGRYGCGTKSGRKLDAPFCHVYQFRDGRITSFEQFTDTEQWARLTT